VDAGTAGSYTFSATLGTIPDEFANTGGNTAKVEAEASIGTTYYATIQAAIDAVVDGDAIQVYAENYGQIVIENK